MLSRLVAEARAQNVEKIVGTYIPTSKNSMVQEHYSKLGFAMCAASGDTEDQSSIFELIVHDFTDQSLPIRFE